MLIKYHNMENITNISFWYSCKFEVIDNKPVFRYKSDCGNFNFITNDIYSDRKLILTAYFSNLQCFKDKIITTNDFQCSLKIGEFNNIFSICCNGNMENLKELC